MKKCMISSCIILLELLLLGTIMSSAYAADDSSSSSSTDIDIERQSNNKSISIVLSFLKEMQSKHHHITPSSSSLASSSSPTESEQRRRPVITLTYAQSLDGKIGLVVTTTTSAAGGDYYCDDNDNVKSSNFPISGKESLLLTHALRSEHDGILVGSGTMKYDNPRLNNRFGGRHLRQPRPIVLDSRMSSLRDCDKCRANNLIVCCDTETADSIKRGDLHVRDDWTIIGCRRISKGKTGEEYFQLDLNDVLEKLYEIGITRLMVEGGASILSSFVEHNAVDIFIVTIAPKIIGNKGLAVFDNISLENGFGLKNSRSINLGCDCVLFGAWQTKRT